MWGGQPDLVDLLLTMLVVVLPLLLGPVLIVLLEAYQQLCRAAVKSPPVENGGRRRQLCLVYVLSSLAIGSYLANLYLVEGFMFTMYQLKVITVFPVYQYGGVGFHQTQSTQTKKT